MRMMGINNVISIAIGIFIILTCCAISYLFQKRLFNKYKNKAQNIVNKDNKLNP
jgi:ABC-type nickel/cobalt efflux system permease component RcnA